MPSTHSGHQGGGSRTPPAQLLEALEAGVAAQAMPMLMEALNAERNALARRMQGKSPPADGPEDLTDLAILGNQITAYERRWRQRFAHPFATWPASPRSADLDAFSLVSDDELHAQLVGQPMIEALERRFVDILDTLDKRLWSLAAALGGRTRPGNPFSPRHLIETLLYTLPTSECNPRLRAAVVRHYERIAGERLGAVYEWCNRQLSDAGLAMASVSDYASLIATAEFVRGGAGTGSAGLWGEDNALTPAESTWRNQGRRGQKEGQRSPGDAVRGNALRQHARERRERHAGVRGEEVRELRSEEFLAVLSLLQGEPAALPDGAAAYEAVLRTGLARVAGGLGIDNASAVPSAAQEDAIDLVGRLFDGLAAGHLLSGEAVTRLSQLALAYLRLALSDPYLFDQPQPPAMQVLSRLVELWDGNGRAGAVDAELHAIADEVAGYVIEEYHGDAGVFERALEKLEGAVEPVRRRASISERRARQSIEGRERLNAARLAADRQLAGLLHRRLLLPRVALFLEEQWRQSLVQAWLREGADSPHFAAAVSLGEAVVRIDGEAGRAEGGLVADRLIELEKRLRDCYVACGLDESGANALLAQLISDFANPDALRGVHEFTPLVDADAAVSAGDVVDPDAPQPGQVLVYAEDGKPPRSLRLAWRSGLTGASLLVNAQGARELLLSPDELADRIAEGALLLRPAEGPVEAVLQRMEREIERDGPSG